MLRIGHSMDLARRLEPGASLAVSGVCLTVVHQEERDPRPDDALHDVSAVTTVELAPETLRRTTLADLEAGSEVNLEPALSAGDALGGHWVQGHVDTTLNVVARRDLASDGAAPGDGEWAVHRELAFELPADQAAFVVEKGSVTLDGVSLTVSRCTERTFEVALIPHTLEITTLDRLEPGMRVNFEVDVLAKYVHRALQVAGRLAGPAEESIPEIHRDPSPETESGEPV